MPIYIRGELLGVPPYVDGVQYLHGGFASVDFVEHLVDLAVRALPNGLDDFPGVGGIRKVVKDNGFP